MICPYCKSEKFLSEIAETNVRNYRNPKISATICCKRPLLVSSQVLIQTEPVVTQRKEDDWGTPFSKPSLVGQFILVKYDYHLTTGTIHEVTEDDPRNSWISVSDGCRSFNRHAVLLSGTKEEMEAASKEHKEILEQLRIDKERHSSALRLWVQKHKK